MALAFGSLTDVGRVRTANEDAMLADDHRSLFVVADGMGGHNAGEVASATALEVLVSRVDAGTSLAEATSEANTTILTKASGDADLAGMGTTLTAVTIRDGRTAVFAHVGDSRAYLMRGGDLTQITEDHSVVEELVRDGRLTPEDAETHPHRSILTRALGVEDHVEVDAYEVDLLPGDRLMLCSDGLTSMVRDPAISVVLRRERNSQRAAETLVDLANRAGGSDNITVIVIDFDPGPEDMENPRPVGAGAGASVGASGGEPSGGEPTGHWEMEEVDPGSTMDAESAADAADAGYRSRRRLSWFRLALYLAPVVAVLLVAAAVTGWYARGTYYVAIDDERVTLFQGVNGGVLWWSPTVERRSDVDIEELTVAQRSDLTDGHRFSSSAGAESFIRRLEVDVARRSKAQEDSTAPRTEPTATTIVP